jgi:pilus assembly protein CpaB
MRKPVPVQTTQAAPAKPAGMIQVLVAAREIGVGTRLTEEDIRWADWPKAAVEDRFIKEDQIAKAATDAAGKPDTTSMMPVVKKEEDQATQTGTVVIGSVAKRRILAGEPIGLEAIIQPGDKSIVAAILPPGMRAISIPISIESAAAGFINPGDRVDVLLASNVRSEVGDNDNKKRDVIVNWSTETILHDVIVLAIDQQLSKKKEDGPAMIGKTATLQVSPADAERLLAAQQLGSLSLVLRSMVVDAKPEAEPLDDTYDDPILFTSDKDVSKGLAALAGGKKDGGNSDKVRVNRGGALSEQSF